MCFCSTTENGFHVPLKVLQGLISVLERDREREGEVGVRVSGEKEGRGGRMLQRDTVFYLLWLWWRKRIGSGSCTLFPSPISSLLS